MKVKRLRFSPFAFLLFFCGYLSPVGSEAAVDHGIYADLLAKYVNESVVNYQGLKDEEARLDQYLKALEQTDTRQLSRNEQFAFYTNAYNAWTIKLILSGYPGVKSIKDLGSFLKSPWKKKICRIDGDILTLDDIEHNILRPRFKDPRVHFAVNCASKGCPPLRAEPYRGDILEKQLDDVARAFINDPARYRLDANTLYVSRIFKWFAGDFDNNVTGFFLKYAQGDLKKGLNADQGNIKVKYLSYDWSLNGY